MPTPLVKTTNIADTSLSDSFGSCTYICCFRSWTFFIYVSGHPTPQKIFFFSIVVLLTSPFILYIYDVWLVMPTHLVKTANIADTSLSGSFRSCTYIWCFRSWTFFLDMCQDGTPPARKRFFPSLVLLLTSPFIIFKYLWGVVDHAYAIGQNHKYRWYVTFKFVRSCIYICCFGPWIVFNHVPGWQPTPQKT